MADQAEKRKVEVEWMSAVYFTLAVLVFNVGILSCSVSGFAREYSRVHHAEIEKAKQEGR